MLRIAYAAFATGALTAIVLMQVWVTLPKPAPLPASQFWARFAAHAGQAWSGPPPVSFGDAVCAFANATLPGGPPAAAYLLLGNLSVAAIAAAAEEAVVMLFPVLDRNGNGKLEAIEWRPLADVWSRMTGEPRRRRGRWAAGGTLRQQDVLARVRLLATEAKAWLQQWVNTWHAPPAITTTRHVYF